MSATRNPDFARANDDCWISSSDSGGQATPVNSQELSNGSNRDNDICFELPYEAADLESQGSLEMTRHLGRREVKGIQRVIFNFTPQWFLITMGTGNLALIMFNIPIGRPDWLYWLLVIVFALDTLLFCLFLAISVLRYVLYPRLFPVVLLHPMQSLYLGPFTVSLATIVILMGRVCLPAWGDWMTYWVWALWWLDSVLSAAVLVGIMYCIFRYHGHTSLDSMATAWLLPSISTIVASAAAGSLASSLPLPTDQAFWTLIVGFVLWGMSVPLALMVLAMFLHRLVFNRLPSSQLAFSVFLPLGPLAQGAHSIMELGKDALQLFPATNTLSKAGSSGLAAGQIIYVFAWLMLLILWAFAVFWLIIAVAAMVYRGPHIPFNLSCWSVIFPTGVFALATMQIGQEMGSRFFDYLGTVFVGLNALLWLVLSGLTVKACMQGELFKPTEHSLATRLDAIAEQRQQQQQQQQQQQKQQAKRRETAGAGEG